MSGKSIFIIVVTVLVTVILMKNTDEVTFWIFGDVEIPKLAVLGVMFVIRASAFSFASRCPHWWYQLGQSCTAGSGCSLVFSARLALSGI